MSGATYDVVDPSPGAVYAQAPRSEAADVDRAYVGIKEVDPEPVP